MKNLLLLSCALIFTLIACKSSAGNKNEIKTIFSPKSQSNVAGTANFIEKNGTVTMVANLSGLTLENTPFTYTKNLIVLLPMEVLLAGTGIQLSKNMANGAQQSIIKEILAILLPI